MQERLCIVRVGFKVVDEGGGFALDIVVGGVAGNGVFDAEFVDEGEGFKGLGYDELSLEGECL